MNQDTASRHKPRLGCIFSFLTVGIILTALYALAVTNTSSSDRRAVAELGGLFLLLPGLAMILRAWLEFRSLKRGIIPKRVQDLVADDFPGVDPSKFEAWKDAKLSVHEAAKSANWIVWPPLILMLLIRGPLGALIFVAESIALILYIFLYVRPRSKRATELQREAGRWITKIKEVSEGSGFFDPNSAYRVPLSFAPTSTPFFVIETTAFLSRTPL